MTAAIVLMQPLAAQLACLSGMLVVGVVLVVCLIRFITHPPRHTSGTIPPETIERSKEKLVQYEKNYYRKETK
jgi:hypothetical protein